MRDCLLSFGLSPTLEAALERVERAVHYGTVNPPRTAHEFHRLFAGGVFYALPVHVGVPVPGRSRR